MHLALARLRLLLGRSNRLLLWIVYKRIPTSCLPGNLLSYTPLGSIVQQSLLRTLLSRLHGLRIASRTTGLVATGTLLAHCLPA